MTKLNRMEQQLFFEFQPIVQVSKNGEFEAIIAKEALLRSNDTNGFPENFFNLSTKSEFETDQLFDCFFKMVNNFFENNNQIRLHVNIDPKQIKLSSTASKLQHWLPFVNLVIIELTEGQMTDGIRNINQIEAIKAYLDQMRNLGFRTAMDDVGTGENQMDLAESLKKRFDLIKFTLVPYINLPDEQLKKELAKWQQFAKQNALEFIIEGIETAEQAGYFANQGFRLQQGFYWDAFVNQKQIQSR